jgi:hypothetical protein
VKILTNHKAKLFLFSATLPLETPLVLLISFVLMPDRSTSEMKVGKAGFNFGLSEHPNIIIRKRKNTSNAT